MTTTISVSDARSVLPTLIERVLSGEEITLTRHGVAVAVLVQPDALRVRRAEAALAAASTVRELLDVGRRTPVKTKSKVTADRANELVRELRSSRSLR